MATEHSEAERHRIIRDALAYRPFATVRDLLDLLTVSPATIRRDIAKLHQSGAIRKVFGGIALPENAASQRLHARPFEENRVLNVAVKQAIAIEAEKLCRDGDTIIVNGGTTCFVFARQLAARALTVFTNSMPVAATLWESGVCHLVVGGGELHREPGVLFTANPPDNEFYASKFFVGAQGIGPNGLMESHPLMARLVDDLARRADEVVVLVDASKFAVRARHSVIPLSRISTLITDSNLTDMDAQMLADEGVNLILVEANNAPGLR
ncbi:DeoR/GlpR family DNA-binding transcription regulator [Devosia sp. ZW T5_3]|uniref:DeoR/GlpR family DNA-binding transcription regulator n=1 Tax=Devosia sp. ZW T5_3 TaxID=3378085 RepID=UPI003854FA5D